MTHERDKLPSSAQALDLMHRIMTGPDMDGRIARIIDDADRHLPKKGVEMISTIALNIVASADPRWRPGQHDTALCVWLETFDKLPKKFLLTSYTDGIRALDPRAVRPRQVGTLVEMGIELVRYADTLTAKDKVGELWGGRRQKYGPELGIIIDEGIERIQAIEIRKSSARARHHVAESHMKSLMNRQDEVIRLRNEGKNSAEIARALQLEGDFEDAVGEVVLFLAAINLL